MVGVKGGVMLGTVSKHYCFLVKAALTLSGINTELVITVLPLMKLHCTALLLPGNALLFIVKALWISKKLQRVLSITALDL